MLTHIYVNQEDIDLGVKKDCHACAVSRAINRHLAPEYAADVASESRILKITYGERRITQLACWMYHVSSTMIPWINVFDRGEPVQPWRFNLDIPERMLKVTT